jgi:oxygen-dependent protoporphyrinogen oxidase
VRSRDEIAAPASRFHPRGHDPATVCQGGLVSGVTSSAPDGRRRVAVVGAGVAGLAAARQLALDGRLDVVVCEASARTGGKLLRGEVAGVATDLGAEALLARRPEALQLMDDLGLSGEVVHPVTTKAGIWSRGQLRALPTGHMMGVPTDLRALAASGVVSRAAVARAALDLVLPSTRLDGDTSVRSFVAGRLGGAVADRLVEPLLGGVYAGRAEALSLRATLPAVAAVAGERSLLRALRAHRGLSPTTVPSGPVVAGLPGGVGRLAEALTDSVVALGVDLRLGTTVRELQRTPAGWRLLAGSTAEPLAIEADAAKASVTIAMLA